MDAETIIFLVICVISIIGSVASAKKKAKEAGMDAAKKATSPSNPYGQLLADLKAREREQWQELERRKQAHNKAHQKAKERTVPAAQIAKPAVPMQPVNYEIPEEGQRVTASRKKQVEETPIERTGLHNKENLKRAIIFGQILEPKF